MKLSFYFASVLVFVKVVFSELKHFFIISFTVSFEVEFTNGPIQ